MYNAKDMYKIALAQAIDNGPVAIPLNGQRTACYALDRDQVETLFEDNHYNLDRSTWRTALGRWIRYGAIVPKIALDKECRTNWFVVFNLLSKDDHLKIRMLAETENCLYYPALAEGAKA